MRFFEVNCTTPLEDVIKNIEIIDKIRRCLKNHHILVQYIDQNFNINTVIHDRFT